MRAGNTVNGHGILNITCATDKNNWRRIGIAVLVVVLGDHAAATGRHAAMRQLRGVAADGIHHSGQIDLARNALAFHVDDGVLCYIEILKVGFGKLTALRLVQAFEGWQIGVGQTGVHGGRHGVAESRKP